MGIAVGFGVGVAANAMFNCVQVKTKQQAMTKSTFFNMGSFTIIAVEIFEYKTKIELIHL